ncbi:S66 family peptidase [Anaeromicropila populeti]|uniref:Muramoyltetrapeptide carboxypeptidase LdcA (Peptidoglycan recycling) n=1 Tax=Anaeromicropila populeti TaxID=37658 RepID=A0A1I6KYQ2_9FIRM|nr:S66 peptidase family protein [Anaeromicropila populeti]SFR96345.1 Muramoyltetrapeptide carboxypeptidase LdcA (peptidoglycan recycling) [Anaeromicropila populeti]
MIYPEFLSQGDTIGVTAPSDGNKEGMDYTRVDYATEHLIREGFCVQETSNVRTSQAGRSSSGKIRAEQLHSLWKKEAVKAIISAKGGDFLMEMLPYLDYEKLSKTPKWFQGYSDNTGLCFTITTICDIATIYGNNFNDFAMEPWHEAVSNNVNLLRGNIGVQKSFLQYEDGWYDKVTGKEGYVLEKDVTWKSLHQESPIHIKGRLLGGCLDVLLNLVGTKYDRVKEFMNRYKEDGILWYLESYDLSGEYLQRGLWQLKEAGWFDTARGFVFGRPCMYRSDYGTTYEEAVMAGLGELSLPVILDADIGHKAPQFTIINGAIGSFQYADGKGSLILDLHC